MTLMAYLDDHPPARRQFYCPRRDGTQPSGVVVVHDAENITDTIGPDTGAEAVARFIATRDTPGSYHDLADSDSIIQLVRYECEAFHDATGTNRHSYGVSGAYRHRDWLSLSQTRRDGFVRNMAGAARRYAAWLKNRRGIVIPARRITVTAARNRVPGFISHAELDPDRRTDPGPHFPWDQFLAEFAGTSSGDDDMTPAECEAVIRKVLNEGTGTGLPNWAATNQQILSVGRQTFNRVGAVQAAVAEVDEATVAALTEAIQEAGGTVTGEVVEAAVRRVFADAATP